MRVLEPPAEVARAADRQEVLRAWIDGGRLSISLCQSFPESYHDDPAEIWGMLLSDVFHHVVDAIVLETSRDRYEVQDSLRQSLDEVVRSERGTRLGTLKVHRERVPELPNPDVTGGDECVEIVRIVLLPDSIRVMALVGMWLPDEEESVWGNLLYDTAAMIASSLRPERDANALKGELLADVARYIDHPSTQYSGEYYGTEESAEQNDLPQLAGDS
jgi:hypothetical protein